MTEIQLVPFETSDREQFIRDNQEAFNYGALEEFGQRDDHFEEDGEIISHETISRSIDEGTAFRIMQDNKPVGGVVIRTEYDHGELELYSHTIFDTGGEDVNYCAFTKDDLKTNESTIKTAAPRGALLAFCDFVSVDAMSGIQYDDRGLRGRCSYGIIK